jgi:hypothetical protein
LRAFNEKGLYLRTLVPFPADLKPEQAANIAKWDEESECYRPVNRQSQLPLLYHWGIGAVIAGVSSKGEILLVKGTNMYLIDLQGGNLRGPLPMWPAASGVKNPNWNVPQLAMSPDGRYIFFSNVADTKYDTKEPSQIGEKWPQGRVYRQDTTISNSVPEPFFDLTLPDWNAGKYWMPNAWNKRTAAYGITVDSKGHLYVCDLVNQQVVEVDPNGKKVSATAMPWPERIHVAANGDYYAITRLAQPRDGYTGKKLLKIKGRGEAAKIVAEYSLKGQLGVASALGVMDGQPVLWIGGGTATICLKDAGETFEEVPNELNPNPESQLDWNRIAADYNRDEIYTSDGGNKMWRYDGKTGAGGILKKNGKIFHGVDVAPGPNDHLYIRTGTGFSGPLERFTRDLEPAPFESGSHVLSGLIYSRYGVGNCEKGLGVGPQGECYINFMYGWNSYFIAGFDNQGKPIQGQYLNEKVGNYSMGEKEKANYKGVGPYPVDLKSAVVGPIPSASGGISVDAQGNIYLGLRLLPKGWTMPASLANDPAYKNWTGSIVKFPPAGGTVLGAVAKDNPESPQGPMIEVDRKMTLVNALAIYPGVGPLSGDGWGGGGSCCVCRVPRFDVDPWGRLVFANAVANSVTLIDNAGNKIIEFGKYGNMDSMYINPNLPTGAKNLPTVAVPAIPLGWPTGATFTEGRIYVNDTYNRRILQLEMSWQDEQLCDVGMP